MITVSDSVFSFSPDHPPVARVRPGDTVRFVVQDCFCGQITDESVLTTEIDFSKLNPTAGPVYVEGAEPGDALCAEILSIDIADRGYLCTMPGYGPMGDWCELRTREVEVLDGVLRFKDLLFPARPMVGVMGTAPASGEVACEDPGPHGGNMDCKLIEAGARAYFPVRTEGALFQLGDLHASMGDGEIGGSGVEIAGSVIVRLGLVKDFQIDWPLVESRGMLHAVASGPEFVSVQRDAARQIQRLITAAWGWDDTDAALYLAARGDSAICQSCKPSDFDMVLRVGAPMEPSMPRLAPLP
ncbi:MAG: acetamidase [Synergistaceae bacterium]|nr:acetamidase/formamidase family protein [Synergistota bacterium]NLM72373.1 acetamidase [Synergistaceae bacterium]